jgi:hypothetical protein
VLVQVYRDGLNSLVLFTAANSMPIFIYCVYGLATGRTRKQQAMLAPQNYSPTLINQIERMGVLPPWAENLPIKDKLSFMKKPGNSEEDIRWLPPSKLS